MRPTNNFFLLALIIFLLFGTVPAVQAQTASTAFTGTITGTVFCTDPPQSYSGNISQIGQIDYWEIKLAVGQKLIIDVDAETIGSSLDAYLEVLDKNEDVIGVNNDEADENGRIVSLDPYLEVRAPSEDYYYIGISSAVTKPPDDPTADPQNDPFVGPYTFVVQCSDQPAPSEFTWPVVLGDLLGATNSKTGSLINITPDNAESTLPYDLGVGPISDVEFDPSRQLVLAAVDTVATIDDAVAVDAAATVDYMPAKIVAVNPDSGNEVASYSLGKELIVALEAAEKELYGITVDPDTEDHSLVLVTLNDNDLTATLTHVFSFGRQTIPALAYHQSEKVMYVANGIELLKIDLALSPVEVQEPVSVELTDLSSVIASIDFSNEDVLYVVDAQGNLYEVTDLTNGAVRLINPISVSGEVSGLTFVVAEHQDDEPVKIICSSTLASQMAADFGSADQKFSRFKKMNRLMSGAVRLFKFKAAEGENVTIKLTREGEEVAATEEESTASKLEALWSSWRWKSEGRLFLGLRDAIPGYKKRARTKGTLPLELAVEDLAEGQYYIMIIQPLFRYNKVDYCLTLESNYDNSQAWESLEVAWPKDESEDDTTPTSAAESKDVQNDTETVDSGSANDDQVPVTLSTTAIEPTSTPSEEVTVEKTGDVPTEEVVPAENPKEPVDVDEDDGVGAPTDADDTAVEEQAEVVPEEPDTNDDEPEVVQTSGDDTPVVEPVAETPVVPEPAADGGDDTEVLQTGADDTTVEEPVVVTADEPVVEPPVEASPAVEDDGEADSGDDSIDEVDDDSMEDPPPTKG